MVTETMMPVNGIELCVATFGEPGDPALLLIAGAASSMDWWDDEFCRRLAAGGRYVIRYDHRDTGRSTSFPAGAPPYSDVDLAHDALGVLDGLNVHRAHLAGLSIGGMLAQRIAVERPHRVLSLTLMSTSTSPPAYELSFPDSSTDSPAEASTDIPAGSPTGASADPSAGSSTGSSADEKPTDWSDRRSAIDALVTSTRRLGGPFTADVAQLRRLAQRVVDRTRDMPASQTNHYICAEGPPIRDRLAEITAPTLILHGTLDPFFTPPHAEALCAAIPAARLVWLEGVGHEFPPVAVWTQVIDEIINQPDRRTQPA
ncbi:alpha/beta fold hydrolase [Actinoplanes sp. TRM 88003]|uniref:Alpha/beta fold hydrolase n=1 Tax=Paractinoplanes aksuensis TaxID=2939490 RepID=A0ABT1DGP6_9ACTN|nr:alpha/beta hydrolase [Actinoplanes aksuensis]MCO8270009.1 alpha/beta fold hydrolase [Actinoplanes aksuensis]